MSDQSTAWSAAAARYEDEFVDPYLPGVSNPLPAALARLAGPGVAADFGCGTGPLLPTLAGLFRRVLAIDFADGMIQRARERCKDLTNIEFLWADLAALPAHLAGQVDVAVAVNSLVLPDLDDLERTLTGIHAALKPGGRFLGIVPAMDGVHYHTMLLLDRARRAGMPQDKARQNAASHAEHELYDFAFGDFRFHALDQHFWQPFEISYRLERAGFRDIRLDKVGLAWEQLACGRELADFPPSWDWFFEAVR